MIRVRTIHLFVTGSEFSFNAIKYSSHPQLSDANPYLYISLLSTIIVIIICSVVLSGEHAYITYRQIYVWLYACTCVWVYIFALSGISSSHRVPGRVCMCVCVSPIMYIQRGPFETLQVSLTISHVGAQEFLYPSHRQESSSRSSAFRIPAHACHALSHSSQHSTFTYTYTFSHTFFSELSARTHAIYPHLDTRAILDVYYYCYYYINIWPRADAYGEWKRGERERESKCKYLVQHQYNPHTPVIRLPHLLYDPHHRKMKICMSSSLLSFVHTYIILYSK